MERFINETEKTFGKLKVLYRDYSRKYRGRYTHWVCECACGNIKSINGHSLRSGASTSCGCKKQKDETGNKFSKLTVIERCNGKDLWKCLCDCGNTVSVKGNSLRTGKTKSCGCITRRIDIPIGTRFSRLTVIGESKNRKNSQILWVCRCDCGKIIEVTGNELRKGNKSKCSKYCTKFGVGNSSFNVVYSSYKKGAKNRELEFSISKDDFRNITSQPCFYCGKLPNQKTGNKELNSEYIYNGIDRVDNSKGYIEGNVVPCCKNCNISKNTMSVQEFREMIINIYSFWVNR